MVLKLRNIQTTTVDTNTFSDVELSASYYNDLASWYNISANNINNLGYEPSLEYPFHLTSNVLSGISPFANFKFIPVVGNDVTEVCMTIEDDWVDNQVTTCLSIPSISNKTYTENITATVVNNIEGVFSAGYNTLILKDEDVFYKEFNIVWDSSLNPTWGIYNNFISQPLYGVSIDFVIDNNTLYAVYDFSSSTTLGQPFNNKWDIKSYGIGDTFPEETPNKFATDIINSEGVISGKTTVASIPVSALGLFTTVSLSSELGVDRYNTIHTVSNSGEFKYTYNEISTNTNAPILSGEIVGDTYNFTVSCDLPCLYKAYTFTKDSFKKHNLSKIEIENLYPPTDILQSTIDSFNQYGAQWYTIISSGDNVELNRIVGIWDTNSDEVTYTSIQSEKTNNFNANYILAHLKNDNIGIKFTEGNTYWNIDGFRFDFNNASPSDVFSFKGYELISSTQTIIDRIGINDTNAVVWDLKANTFLNDNVQKTQIATIWPNNNVSYNYTNIINNKENNIEQLFTPTISSDGQYIYLLGNAEYNYSLEGYRTSVNNLSSFTRNVDDIVIENGDGYLLNSSPYTNNLWTVYASGEEGQFLAEITSNKTNSQFKILTNNFPTTSVEFDVQSIGPNYELYITNPTSTFWNITGYRIDDSAATLNTLQSFGSVELEEINTYSNSAENLPDRRFLITAEKEDGIYHTQLIDYIWSPYFGYVNDTTNYINSTNTSTTSLCEYRTNTNVIPYETFNDGILSIGLSSTQYSWDLSYIDVTKELAKISTNINKASIIDEDYLFDYTFSHPGLFSASLSSSNESIAYENLITVEDIAPQIMLHFSTSATTTIEGEFSAAPSEDFLSYYDTSYTNPISAPSNQLYFTFANTKPGSFPIFDISIDWNDGSGITSVTREGVANIGNNTRIFELSTLFQTNIDDVRRYYFWHEFPSSDETFIVSVSARNLDTLNTSTETFIITGFQGITEPVGVNKRLIKSNLRSDNSMIYNIQTDDVLNTNRPVGYIEYDLSEPYADIFSCSVSSILIEALEYVDDDLRIRINDSVISDTQYNIAWYSGFDYVSSKDVDFSQPDNFRKILLTSNILSGAGPGDVVYIDTFDGWAGATILVPWQATITYNTGAVYMLSGGMSYTGSSSTSSTSAIPNYYTTGPYLFDYYENGNFIIPSCSEYSSTLPGDSVTPDLSSLPNPPLAPTVCPCTIANPTGWPCGGLTETYTITQWEYSYVSGANTRIWRLKTPHVVTSTVKCLYSGATYADVEVSLDSGATWTDSTNVYITVNLHAILGWTVIAQLDLVPNFIEVHKTTGLNPIGSYSENVRYNSGVTGRMNTASVTQ